MRIAIGPKRAPGRCDVPPSNGAPTMTTSAAAESVRIVERHPVDAEEGDVGPVLRPVAAHSLIKAKSFGLGVRLVVDFAAVEADSPHREQDGDHAADDDAGVGQVEDRPVVQVDPVDDVAAQRAGRPEQPVTEVAERAAEQQAERPGPAGRARAGGTPGR